MEQTKILGSMDEIRADQATNLGKETWANPTSDDRASDHRVSDDSVVKFANERRAHMGLTVSELNPAIAYYSALFGQQPTKVRPGYAKFEVSEPPLNLTLNEDSSFRPVFGRCDHFGIQVKQIRTVAAMAQRMEEAGYDTLKEEGVVCCYARQDKIWVADPDGRKWEVFVVLQADAEEHAALPAAPEPTTAEPTAAAPIAPEPVATDDDDKECCAPTCCT